MDCKDCEFANPGKRCADPISWLNIEGEEVCRYQEGATQAQTDEAVVRLNLLLAAKDLANACRVHLSKICTCSVEYRQRKKQDPTCEYCDVGKFLLPLADKILSS